jgi:hypothetical protein
MTSKALLFGLNYLQDPACRLNGCINDVKNVQTLLLDRFGYRQEDILTCTDQTPIKPTKSMMTRLLRELVLSTHRMQIHQIFISYSGHGMNVGSNVKDDALVPLDFRTQGIITDYELAALIRQVHPRTDVVVLVDACHSGSMCNLPYVYSPVGFVQDESQSVAARVLLISGCRDDQTSQETFTELQRESGVATNAFIDALSVHNYDVTCTNLIRYMNKYMQDNNYAQRPQLSSSRTLSETCIFVTSASDGRPFFVV